MNKKTISKKILKSFLDGDGYNYNAEGKKVEFNSGYMVSVEGKEYKGASQKIIFDVVAKIEAEKHIIKLLDYLEYVKKLVDDGIYKNLVIGFWKNEKNIFIDLSLNVKTKADALLLAKRNKQIAIYDIKNQKEIYLNKNK
jgi:hypothetical protein